MVRPTTYIGAVSCATRMLTKAKIQFPCLEARLLVAHAAGVSTTKLLTNPEAEFTAEKKLNAYLKKRLKHYPIQYILGQWEFYGREFYVGPGVLVPRADSEILVETALRYANTLPNAVPFVLEPCAGSGCISISIEAKLQCNKAVAIELLPEACDYLEKNIFRSHSRVEMVCADVLDPNTVEPYQGKVDMIICNPPYLSDSDMNELQAEVSFEPREALYGGKDGYTFYEKLPELWKKALVPNGYLIFEIGIGMADRVSELLEQQGFKVLEVVKDYNEIDRVVVAKLCSE